MLILPAALRVPHRASAKTAKGLRAQDSPVIVRRGKKEKKGDGSTKGAKT